MRVVVVVELFPVLESGVAELIVAVLLMVIPTGPLAVATSVIVADEPLATEVNVTMRLLPEPSHWPPVELHETNVTEDGKVSVTVTFCATAAPLLVKVSV